MISTTSKIRGYVRPLSRIKASGQRAKLREYGIRDSAIYEEDKDGESLEALIRSLRKGEAVGVTRLHVLAPPKLKMVDRPRRELWAAIRAIEAKGATIIEVESGRTTASKADRDDMIADAIEALTHAGRSPRRRDGAGRPPKVFTPEQVEIARKHWFDIRHKTNAAALAATLKEVPGWTMTRFYKAFKRSGRNG